MQPNRVKYTMGYVCVNLKDYCSYRIGSAANAFFVDSYDKAISAYHKKMPMVGLGSKILFGKVDRVAIMRLKGVLFDGDRVFAQAGVPLPHLAYLCRRRGLSGLEWACGIPGSVGGAVKMNAGAFGKCISDCLESVTVCDGDIKTVPKQKLFMAYRSGVTGCIVLGCVFKCSFGCEQKIYQKMRFYAEARRTRQPQGFGCGSVFVASQKPAGWYIDNAGLKGVREGGAEISQKHANFFLNCGTASASDVKRLINRAKQKVYEVYKVNLHEEIIYIGEFND